MDWGQIQTILTVVFGVVAVVSLIVAIKLKRRKKPVWAYETEKIIGLGTNAPPELQLVFNDMVVPDVYRTTVILYNKGSETIRKSDVNEAITIRLKNGGLLREPNLLKVSRQQIRLSSIRRGDNSVEMDFLYLDHNDGAVIELLHTQYEEIYCDGDIMGAGRPSKLGKFYSKSRRYKISRPFIYSIYLAIPLILTMLILIQENWSLGRTTLPVIGLVWLVVLTQFIPKLWSDSQYLRFPKWSRSKDNE